MNRLFAVAALLAGFLLSSCATNGSAQAALTAQPAAKALDVPATRAWLRDFGAKYSYDVGYMEQLLDTSPAAYESFAAAMAMAEHRARLPVDAHFVACISALTADDCGACTQLNLRMAVEAGVDRGLLRQLLADPSKLPPVLRMVHDHARQVVKGGSADPQRVARLRQALGDDGFAEIAVNVLGCRIYPGLRRAMGAEVECPAPTLDF